MADAPADSTAPGEQPLELILARNLVSIIALPALVFDVDGQVVFFNDAAAEVIGSPFEELGTMPRERWNAMFGPFDASGHQVPSEELPLTIALREGRPAYARFHVRGEAGLTEIEAGALPLVGPAGYHGAILVFWPVGDEVGG
jgi:PAS domain-containing protein